MGAITGTLAGNTEFAGQRKVITVTATMAAASDTITLTAASHGGVTAINGILGVTVTGGMDADFQTVQASYSGLVITLTAKNGAGGAATDFTGTTVEVALLVTA